MTFDWALQQMRQGKKVRRVSWPPRRHLGLEPGFHGDGVIMVRWEGRQGAYGCWQVPQGALLAGDWELA